MPSLSVIPPEDFCSIRGVLLREGTSSPNVSVGDGNPSLHHCMGPRIREDDKKGSSESSFPRRRESIPPTGRSQKGRRDINKTVGTHCAPCTVEGVLRCAQQPGCLCAANIWH